MGSSLGVMGDIGGRVGEGALGVVIVVGSCGGC